MRGFDKGGIDRQTRCFSHVQCPCWLSKYSDTHLISKLSQSVVNAFFLFWVSRIPLCFGTSNNNHIYKEMCIANLSSVCEGSKLPHVCIQWTNPAMKGGQHWKAVDTPHHSASKQKIEYLFCLCGTLSKV
jgi:hypothetical protein